MSCNPTPCVNCTPAVLTTCQPSRRVVGPVTNDPPIGWATSVSFLVPPGVDYVDAVLPSTGTPPPITITLPTAANARKLQLVKVNSVRGNTAVTGGTNGFPIAGGDLIIPEGSSAWFQLDADCEWIALLGGGANEDVQLRVPNIAALAALPTAGLADLTLARVLTVDDQWQLVRTSTTAPDGITVVAALGGGNWIRNQNLNGRFSLQTIWYVDPASTGNPSQTPGLPGSDENDGVAPATALKSVAEALRRLHLMRAGKNYTINVLNDVPAVETAPRPFGTVLLADRYRPSGVFQQNSEDANAITGTEQVFNMTLQGVRTSLTGGVGVALTGAGYVPTDNVTGVQATINATGIPGGVAANIGNMLVLTSGPNAGATAWIGADLTGGTARITDFISAANAFVPAQAAGVTFDIVRVTQWGPSFIQCGNSQGRYQMINFDFTPPPPPPADQENITFRTVNITFRTCRFRRPIQPSGNTLATAAASAFVYQQMTVVNQGIGEFTWGFGTLMLNTDFRLFVDDFAIIFGLYLEHSLFTTVVETDTPDYGSVFPASSTLGALRLEIGTPAGVNTGMGIFNAPAIDASGQARTAAAILSDDTVLRIGNPANLYGTNPAVATGVLVRGSSKLIIQDSVTPTISGLTNDVLIDNPSGGGAIACSIATPMVAGPVAFAAATMATWAAWVAAPFNRFAFNPATGSQILSAA